MSEIPYDSDMTYDSDTTYDGVTTDVVFLGSTPVKLYLGDLPVSEEILVGVR